MLPPRPTAPLECFCGTVYSTSCDLEEHRSARGHYSSHGCKGSCKHPPALPDDGLTRVCGYCGKFCERPDIFWDHAIATGHSFCSNCNLNFPSRQTWSQHCISGQHASNSRCSDHNMPSKDVHTLPAHMESHVSTGPLPLEVARSHKKRNHPTSFNAECTECGREFSSPQSLQQHCASLNHSPLGLLKCPAGFECRRIFHSPSALFHHLESGKCPSGMQREKMYSIVELCDLDIISHAQSVHVASTSPGLPAYNSPFEDDLWAVLSEVGSDWLLPSPIPSLSSADDSWEQRSLLGGVELKLRDGQYYSPTTAPSRMCPMCPRKRATFSTGVSLQQHIDSPFHSPKVYKCPSSDREDNVERHIRRFSTLSGLCQHLERDICESGKRTLFRCATLFQEQLTLGRMQLTPSVSKP